MFGCALKDAGLGHRVAELCDKGCGIVQPHREIAVETKTVLTNECGGAKTGYRLAHKASGSVDPASLTEDRRALGSKTERAMIAVPNTATARRTIAL